MAETKVYKGDVAENNLDGATDFSHVRVLDVTGKSCIIDKTQFTKVLEGLMHIPEFATYKIVKFTGKGDNVEIGSSHAASIFFVHNGEYSFAFVIVGHAGNNISKLLTINEVPVPFQLSRNSQGRTTLIWNGSNATDVPLSYINLSSEKLSFAKGTM